MNKIRREIFLPQLQYSELILSIVAMSKNLSYFTSSDVNIFL